MYQALYRKYRPTTFEDVCGQEHITSVLKAQLQSGRVSHAYMFCGSRGTGKTTCAKILAKAVNCENPIDGEPCNQCDSCRAINEERVLDVVEMDAASNNGVDHIRRLCDEVQFLPSEVKKRVYIIDEVHMLSSSAFNALLKTIEEPPSHVLFILATTEMNDIPATIMSRCQRFDFKRITPMVIVERLLQIAQKEQIPLQRDAAQVLARLSDGAMRDALSLLEACQGFEGDITAEKVHDILGLGSRGAVLSLCRAIAEHNTQEALRLVADIYEKLSDFKEVVGELISIYRNLLVIHSVSDYRKYIEGYENEYTMMEEIAKLLTVETILYQVSELEKFYLSFDRIATGKKASSEILIIRLCKEELSQEPGALLSRISRLESGATFSKSAPVTTQKQKKVPSAAELQTEDKEIKTAEAPMVEQAYSESLKLKNALQSITSFKPWIQQMSFRKEGTILHVLVGSFAKNILIASGAKQTILEVAQKIDTDIQDLIFDEKTEKSEVNTTGFEGL